jgi:hypothetical protein
VKTVIMPGQLLTLHACEALGIGRGPACVIPHVWTNAAPASKASCVDSICSSGVIGTAGLLAFCGRDPVMATLMTVGRVTAPIIPQFVSSCLLDRLRRPGGLQSRMLSERDTVLHSWCRQADWAAPTIVGGAGARIQPPMAVPPDMSSSLSAAIRPSASEGRRRDP